MKPEANAFRENALPRAAAFAVLGAALVVRGGAMLLLPSAFETDIDGYLRLARNLVDHGVLGVGNTPTALRPPLYPLLLAPITALPAEVHAAGIGLLHLMLGLATVALTLHVGRRLGIGRASALAGVLVAVDPLLVYWGTQIMTETLHALLLLLTVAAVVEFWLTKNSLRWGMAAGCFAGLAALCRPETWVFIAAVFLILIVRASWLAWMDREELQSSNGRKSPWLRLLGGAAIPFAALLVCVPWAVRNAGVLGAPVVTTTHGGYTLLLANNPLFYSEVVNGPAGAVWDRVSSDRWHAFIQGRLAGLSEVDRDWACYGDALGHIRDQPIDFLRSVRLRVVRLWRLTPHARGGSLSGPSPGRELARYAVGAFYVVEFLLLIASLASVRSWRPPWLVLPVLLVATTLVYAFYWSNMRMRAPVMPTVAMLVAAVVARWREKS